MTESTAAPQWTPTQEGGVQLDWHERGIDLEIEFTPAYAEGHAVFIDQEGREPEWDGPVSQHLERLLRIFRERLTLE